MISNMPDWITAGTAVTAVLGGLFGVYSTTQSRIDIADERMANTIEILERLSVAQEGFDGKVADFQDRLVRSEVSAEYLKEGQERVDASLNTLAGEMKQLTQTVLAEHVRSYER